MDDLFFGGYFPEFPADLQIVKKMKARQNGLSGTSQSSQIVKKVNFEDSTTPTKLTDI